MKASCIKVLLLASIFCITSPMAAYSSISTNFSSGDESLIGHGGFFDKFKDKHHNKSHHKDYKWKFKNCKFPIYHDYSFDKEGCSERELSKGKVNICKQINHKDKSKILKLCISEKAANKLLASKWGDGDPSNDNGVLSYYSPITFYQDQDGDNYGTAETVTDCLPPDGYVENQGDCDDTNAAINPGEADGCPVIDGIDNNCDSIVDNGVQNIFADLDGDGFGGESIVGCPGSPNTSLEGGDCNDNNADVNPNAVEVACNSIDDDCDAQTSDNDGGVTVYQDSDLDTFGNPTITDISYCGVAVDGFVSNNADCDDTNQNINPTQSEIACNGIDDDCDANTSDNDGGQVVYLDSDGDGYGSMTSQIAFCGDIPNGYVADNTDCNDSLASTNPGAAEVCDDGIDNNCDGEVDENCSAGCPVVASCPIAVGGEPKINEFSVSTAGIDVEYVEIIGEPNTDYSAYKVLSIEGDTTGAGIVDRVISLGVTDANGIYLASLPNAALENGTLTLLLVKDFNGSQNDDLDTSNNGVFDITPWAYIADAVAVNDGGTSDVTYAITLTVGYDGLAFAPGGASRIGNGCDTESQADWKRNDFDLAGIPGFTGSLVEGEAINTPGEFNKLWCE